MPRHIQDFRLQEPAEQTFADIYQHMISSGFKYLTYEGESLFKKGNGWLTAPTFVKVTYGPDKVRLEAWIKYAILPGVYAGEMGKDGFVGSAVKGNLKKSFAWISNRLGGQMTALCPARDTEPSQMPPLDMPIEQLMGRPQ